MGTSDGSLRAARLSSEVELKCGEVNEFPNWPTPSREKDGSSQPVDMFKIQLKALPKKCISAQLVWVNRGKCAGILTATLKNEPTDLYIQTFKWVKLSITNAGNSWDGTQFTD